jgi:hypothetical protein
MVVPTSKVKEVAAMLKAVHAREDRTPARQKAEQVRLRCAGRDRRDVVLLCVSARAPPSGNRPDIALDAQHHHNPHPKVIS